MELHSLKVSHFGCVEHAEVTFGPGLNILYGPNDLGKSTLAAAIRTCLLVQSSSKVGSSWQPWGSDESPEVWVVFQTEPGRYWRVKKRFGTGARGMATLEASKDGLTFTVDAKAREVDGRVRELLGWGIASPGGKNAPRGLPTAFLSTVVLGEQVDVAGILRQTLEADTNEDGKERLTTALAAFAQDPLFKQILDEGQAKFDEAFTAKGYRKRGRTSPFQQPTEDVRQAQSALTKLKAQVERSKEIEASYQVLADELQVVSERHEALLAEQQARQAVMEQVRQRTGVQEELTAAQAHVASIAASVAAFQEREGEVVERTTSLQASKDGVAEHVASHAQAEAGLEGAREQRRILQSGEAELERSKRVSELEREQAQTQSAIEHSRHALEAAQRGMVLHQKAQQARHELERLETAAQLAESQQSELQTLLTGADADLKRLDGAKRQQALDRTEASLTEATEAQTRATKAKATAVEHRAQAAGLSEGEVPTRQALKELQSLKQELAVAEAALGGGVSVQVTLTEPMNVGATVDGKAQPTSSSGIALEADASVELKIGSIATVTVSAGARDARAKAAQLRARWSTEAEPVLHTWKVSDLVGLTALVEAGEARKVQADDLQRKAEISDREAEHSEKSASGAAALKDEAAALRRELTGFDPEAVRELLDSDVDLVAMHKRAEQQQRVARVGLQELTDAAQAASPQQATFRERLREAEAGLLAMPQPASDWETECKRLSAEEEEGVAKRQTLKGQISTLREQGASEVQDATAAVETAEAAERAAQTALESAQAAQSGAVAALAQSNGRLDEQRLGVERLDLSGAQVAAAAIQVRLVALPTTGLLDEETVRQLDQDLHNAAHDVEVKTEEVQRARGALETVGGAVIEDERQVAEEALAAAERNEREVEVEFDAWKLLVETLREAENTDGSHLGSALGTAVSARFGELTQGRYGELDMGPDLGVQGLFTGGALRDIDRLSAGTRDQLATLLRLTIAEQLGSSIVLDDQLTHTDDARGGWFRDTLRARAERSQVIVVTCRPTDYVLESNLPGVGESAVDRAGGGLRCVSLVDVIERSPRGS